MVLVENNGRRGALWKKLLQYRPKFGEIPTKNQGWARRFADKNLNL